MHEEGEETLLKQNQNGLFKHEFDEKESDKST